MEGHWSGYIGSLHVHWDTLITMWAAMLFVIFTAFLITRKLQIIPGKVQVVAESIVSFFTGSLSGVKDAEKQVPLGGSLFLLILFANLMGQLPL